jgi:hypothetical protein
LATFLLPDSVADFVFNLATIAFLGVDFAAFGDDIRAASRSDPSYVSGLLRAGRKFHPGEETVP